MTRKRSRLILLLLTLVSCSRGPEGYYELGTEKLQLRIVVPADKNEEVSAGWQKQTDYRGTEFFVSPKVEFDENDIEGIRVKDSDIIGDSGLGVVFYFKPTSWGKIYKRTRELENKWLGFVKGGKLFIAGQLAWPIDREVTFGGHLDAPDITPFLKGFNRTQQTSQPAREVKYVEWLQQRIQDSRDDYDAMADLAYKYLTGESSAVPQDYRKAVSFYEYLMRKQPHNKNWPTFLRQAYAQLGEYDKAIKIIEDSIAAGESHEWAARADLARLYADKGEYQKALKEFEKSKQLLQATKIPEGQGFTSRKSWESRLNSEIEKLVTKIDKKVGKQRQKSD
jgi:hypothetical protein